MLLIQVTPMKHKRPLGLTTYKLLSYGATPLFYGALYYRMHKGKEDRQRLHERMGRSLYSWQELPVIWVHGASVGESLSSLTLICALAKIYPNVRFIMTTGTTSSAGIIGHKLPNTAIHQYFPLDNPIWITKFLNKWKPKAILFVESELWPNWLDQIQRRHIPCFLINARMSDKSFNRWKKFPDSIGYLLQTFHEIYGQSKADRKKFQTLGGNATKDLGNLKLARLAEGSFNEPNEPFFNFNDQPAWLLASSHHNEEEIMADMHLRMQKSYPQLHTCIMPRHIGRNDEIEMMLKSKNIQTTRFSRGEMPQPGGVFLFDVMGQAQEFYMLQQPTLIGRSFAKGGGQNPIEAAFQGCGILLGPDMRNFQEIADDMIQNQAAISCQTIDALEQQLRYFFDHPGAYQQLAKRSFDWVQKQSSGVLQNYLDQLTPNLDQWVLR